MRRKAQIGQRQRVAHFEDEHLDIALTGCSRLATKMSIFYIQATPIIFILFGNSFIAWKCWKVEWLI